MFTGQTFIYLFIHEAFTELEMNKQNEKWTRQLKLKAVFSPHTPEFLSLPSSVSKKKTVRAQT